MVGPFSTVWLYSAYCFAGLPNSEFEWSVFLLFFHAHAWTDADGPLCDLIEVWNQVWLLLSFLLFEG